MAFDTSDPNWRDKVPKFKTAEERTKWLRENLGVPDEHNNDPDDPDSWICPGELPPDTDDNPSLDPNHLKYWDNSPYKPYVVFVNRGEWGAVPPKARKKYSSLPVVVRFVHTNTITPQSHEGSMEMLRSVQYNHMFTEGYVDIQYNFMVGYDGEIYEGRGWTSQPDRIEGRPDFPERIDIAYIGCYPNHAPPWEPLVAAFDLVEYGIHNKLLNKSCKFIHLDPKMPMF